MAVQGSELGAEAPSMGPKTHDAQVEAWHRPSTAGLSIVAPWRSGARDGHR